jgi:S-methylmethionine-dependent homocysteine/selenocysteine methylase
MLPHHGNTVYLHCEIERWEWAMIILDGGMGRQLKAMGAPFRQPEWSALSLMEGPEFVRSAHDAFIEAGADMITTNSYAVVPHHIGEEVFAHRAGELLDIAAREAANAARSAGRHVRVAASVPPMFGSYLPEKFDPVRGKEMMKKFRHHLGPVADVFVGETLGSIAEVMVFLGVFQDVAADIWVSVTLEDVTVESGVPRLRSGEALDDLLSTILSGEDRVRCDALLFNCSQPEVMADAVSLARKRFDSFASQHGGVEPLVGVYANAFPLMDEKYQGSNTAVHQLRADITPGNYTKFAQEWARLGANVIGGCCGIAPDHIAHLAAALKAGPERG